MDISLYLSSLPVPVNFVLLVIIPTALSMCGPAIARRLFGLDWLLDNNEVAGFKFAVLGVIYAVLLGFAVIVVWEKFSSAGEAVTQEAAGVVSVYRLSGGLDAGTQAAVRAKLRNYVETVTNKDWPAMSQGRLDPSAGDALSEIYEAVLSFNPQTRRDEAVLNATLRDLDILVQGRRTRLVLVSDVMPSVLWYVLFAGAFVTLMFTFFFGSRSLRAQTFMAGLLATLMFMGLFVIVEIDHPFTGPVSVGPDALLVALAAAGH
jgi:hypothetical protein